MEKTVQYWITTQTSKEYKYGATGAKVYMQMMGNNYQTTTPWIALDRYFHKEFRVGQEDKFKIKTTDVGLPEVIRLKVDKKRDKDGWLCDYVGIKTESSGEVFFSVYDFVVNEIAVRAGKATLPQEDTETVIKDIRRLEVERNKDMYRWHIVPARDQLGWDLPRYIHAENYEDLPLLFQANDIRLDDFLDHRKTAIWNTLIEAIRNKFSNNRIKELDDYFKVFHLHSLPSDKPPFFETWNNDDEFGRQMLNGVNPTAIARCLELPKEMQSFEEEIFGNKTICAEQIKAKRLYYINYRGELDGLKRNVTKNGEQLHCTDSICLLQVGDDKKIRPIAIQLEDGGHVFTPRDTEDDWMLAKFYFRNTDVNIHEYQAHLLRTHIVMEPIAIGMFRCLSRSHPIYKMLRPHLQTVVAINTLGRTFLIGKDAAVNFTLSMNGLEMTRKAFRDVTFEDLNVPASFKKKGTDDTEALPYYHFREDAIVLWASIQKFSANMVNAFYKSNQDIVDDSELCEFIRTVAEDGIGWAGEGTKGFPAKLDTISELVHYITIIIYTSTVQHAASNFGQYEIYKYIPNAPGGLRLPPHKKGEANMQRILNSLPDPIMASLQAVTSNTLSSFSPNEIYMGDYPMKLFTESNVLEIMGDFRKDLRCISEKIKKRNEALLPALPYEYLLPERIPNSIAV